MWLAERNAMKTDEYSRIEPLLRHYEPLMRFATQLCNSPAKAMLLTQRTLRMAFERSRSAAAPGNIRGWLLSLLLQNFVESHPRTRGA
jgi:DNA-directed RNA polymerase specialized sigma24 family protein